MKDIELYITNYFRDKGIPLYNNRGASTVAMSIYGYRVAGTSTATVWRFANKWFPNKPKMMRLYVYILDINNKRHCGKCDKVLDKTEFHSDVTTNIKLSAYCKECKAKISHTWTKNNRGKHNARGARYRAAKLSRTAAWGNKEKIQFWYDCCPKGFVVDHVIPLQGGDISGLHIETNLQWLTPKQNSEKHNKWSNT